MRDEFLKLPGQLQSVALAAALALAASVAGATEPCGICDEKVVTNSTLAECFLDEYPALAGKANGAIAVDLSACEQPRGVVTPLAMPEAEGSEPSVKFVLTRAQLDCLKKKLEDKATELDPSAVIELDSCE